MHRTTNAKGWTHQVLGRYKLKTNSTMTVFHRLNYFQIVELGLLFGTRFAVSVRDMRKIKILSSSPGKTPGKTVSWRNTETDAPISV